MVIVCINIFYQIYIVLLLCFNYSQGLLVLIGRNLAFQVWISICVEINVWYRIN